MDCKRNLTPLSISTILAALSIVAAAPAAELPITGTLDLSAADKTQATQVKSSNKGQLAGRSVASIGDFNGDGKNDYAIGEPNYGAYNVKETGAVHIIFGGDQLKDGYTLEPGKYSLSVYGASLGDHLGASVDHVGPSVAGADVNGDGLSDLVIGAPDAQVGAEGSAQTEGRAYVVFGRRSADAIDLAGDFGGFVINGERGADQAGSAVSSYGDLNGDGLADFLVAAEKSDPGGRENAGSVYVIFGKTSTNSITLGELVVNSGQGIRLDGPQGAQNGGALLGRGLSSIKDLNGDRLPEILVSAPRAGNGKAGMPVGNAYVVWGMSSPQTLDLEFIGSHGYKITGSLSTPGKDSETSTNGDFLGQSIAPAGDVNADGKTDLVIGAHLTDSNNRLNPGKAWIIYGTGSGTDVNLDTLSKNDGFYVVGIDRQDQAGYFVSSAGDFNADGVDDVMVASPHADPLSRDSAGAVYVIWGSRQPQDNLDLATFGNRALRVAGPETQESLGYSVAPAGDVNGDGGADVLIGRPGRSKSANSEVTTESAGGAYFVFGAASSKDTTAEKPGANDPGTAEEETVGHCTAADNVELVIDDSGSMYDSDPQRLRAIAVEIMLAKERNIGEIIGAAEFGDEANAVFAPFKIGDSSAPDPVKLLEKKVVADNGGTDYNIGFSSLANENPTSDARIFLTDGEHNVGEYTEQHRGGPPTYVIALVPYYGLSKKADKRLARIAKETGGKYFADGNAQNIQAIMNEIDSKLNCDVNLDAESVKFTKDDQSTVAEHKLDSGTHSADVVLSWGDRKDRVEIVGLDVVHGDKVTQHYGYQQIQAAYGTNAKTSSTTSKLVGERGTTFRTLRVRGIATGSLRVKLKAKEVNRGRVRVHTQIATSRRRS